MEYFAVIDISSFIWCKSDFDSNTTKYYELMLNMPNLFEYLKKNNSPVLLKEGLYYQIVENFPYHIAEKGFYDFQKMTFSFLSNLGSNMIIYSENDDVTIVSVPNLVKKHFNKDTHQEVRYLITRIHSKREPENKLFSFEYIWNYKGNLSTTKGGDTFEHETILSDEEHALENFFAKYKRRFVHNPKHDKYKSGGKISPLSCYNEREMDTTKAQSLLDGGVLVDGSYYNFDTENNVWVVFYLTEKREYHGFDENDRSSIPEEVKRKINK
jgi:hypothetical protein